MNIKSILRRVAYGYKAESSSYIEHLKSLGMKIGSDCIIYAPTKTLIDEQYPWMITIGDHVKHETCYMIGSSQIINQTL